MVFLTPMTIDMLFYLTDSLIVEEADHRFGQIKRAVYHLAIQAANGNHAVIGDIKAISHFRAVLQTDFVAGPYFNKIHQNIAFEVVPSFLKYYVEVVLDAPSTRIENDTTIVQVNYSQLIPLESTNKTSLVCEFLNDAEFYAYVLRWFSRQNGANVHFAFNSIDGGGTNMDQNIQKELDAHHITLAIVDTDCRYPSSPINPQGTYGKCIGIGAGNVLFRLVPLEVHELENLIPLNFIDQEFSNRTNNDAEYARKKIAFDYLRKDAEHILPYYDYKKGIKNTLEYRNKPELQTFARTCYELNDDKMATQPDFNVFISTVPDKGYVYTELIGGTGIINMTIEMIKNGNAPEPTLYNFQRNNWNKIGQEMLNWCFARRPEAIH